MLTNYLILDVASAPIPDAACFLEEPQAPSNWKDPEKIAAYVAEERGKALGKAALDLDLARITAIGWQNHAASEVLLCGEEEVEREALRKIRRFAEENLFVTFNGFKFDLPLILRRCVYLGVPAPAINLDKYRSPHVDLWNRLTQNGALSAHSLSFYIKRFGWSDLTKPLMGAEEAQIFTHQRWNDLGISVEHDLEATKRLAQKMGVIG